MKTKTETQHTPTPWQAVKWTDDDNGDYLATKRMALFGQGNAKGISSEMLFESNSLLPIELSKANAAFIVRAVNSHEDLKNALDECLKEFEQMDHDGNTQFWKKFCQEKRKLILQAEGK